MLVFKLKKCVAFKGFLLSERLVISPFEILYVAQGSLLTAGLHAGITVADNPDTDTCANTPIIFICERRFFSRRIPQVQIERS
jgi:hypothetical protein